MLAECVQALAFSHLEVLMSFLIPSGVLIAAVALLWLRPPSRSSRLLASALILGGAVTAFVLHPSRGAQRALEGDVASFCTAYGKQHEDEWREWTRVQRLSPEQRIERWAPHEGFVWLAADLCLEGPAHACADRVFSGLPERFETQLAEMVAAFKEGKSCAIE